MGGPGTLVFRVGGVYVLPVMGHGNAGRSGVLEQAVAQVVAHGAITETRERTPGCRARSRMCASSAAHHTV